MPALLYLVRCSAEYAGDMNPWVYFLSYNITYMGPETLVTMALAFIPKGGHTGKRKSKGTDKRMLNA